MPKKMQEGVKYQFNIAVKERGTSYGNKIDRYIKRTGFSKTMAY